ncbi:glycosyltransferase [Desulfovibrio inopinatus]|uniref:glycosyltransferase n=1 Tax=Desulfovibrio inopinatus TaxID=102109 RepID=UPI0004848715|nr:glycosyltransferase [Desulfovibrio inopinatus]
MTTSNTSPSFSRPSGVRAAWASLPATVFYVLLAWAIVAALPVRAWNLKTQALVSMSLFGLWRYSWQILHFIRHWIYRRRMFPRLRDEAMAVENPYPKRLYIMVPSYQEEPEVSRKVFTALIREARTIPSQVHIYASVGSDEEVQFISNVIRHADIDEEIETVFMHQSEGKRVAMGHALRAIARDYNTLMSWHPDAENDVVVFMDGDTLVQPGIFQKTLPYFRSNPKVGALTTDNVGQTADTSSIFNDWYTAKFAQRNHIFHSHSLSRRVLTVTGRFSLYRADVVVDEEFIRFLEADYLDHWLFGRFRFLMGDDKSTWYYLLKNGMEMLYIPDAKAVALETRQTHFIKTSMSLMQRWYGNMLRNNWRAIRLGPKPMGFFIWWCILDQRFSTFTPLVGPISVLLLSIFDSWFYLAFYASWIILTRLVLMWFYVIEGMPMTILHIPLTLYNQWVGSLVKIFCMHSLSKQTWDKDNSTDTNETAEQEKTQRIQVQNVGDGFARGFVRLTMLSFNLGSLIILCGIISGAFMLPTMSELESYRSFFWPERLASADTSAPQGQDDTVSITTDSIQRINAAIASLPEGKTLSITLPSGGIILDEPLIVNKDHVHIQGAGTQKTRLISHLTTAQAAAAIQVGGHKGPVVGHMEGAANTGDTVVGIDNWPKDSRYVWLGAPNDDAFFDSIGDTNWRQAKPWIRQFIADVISTGQGYIVLKQGLPEAFPPGTEVRATRLVSDVSLSGFTIEQAVPGHTISDVMGVYENSFPEYEVDAIRFDWATQCRIDDVAILAAGSHALVFENSRDITADHLTIDGSWNKGKDGNGYVRFARAYDNVLENSRIANIRHLAFQWGASGNVVKNCTIETDVNFHGGYSQNNQVRHCTITPPPGHPWGKVTTMPSGGAHWAPPDGAGNVVLPNGAQEESKSMPFLLPYVIK